jgi:hypothetical protein
LAFNLFFDYIISALDKDFEPNFFFYTFSSIFFIFYYLHKD